MEKTKNLLLILFIFVVNFVFGQDVKYTVERQLNSYFQKKGINFQEHTIYVYDVNSTQKFVYAITNLNMLQSSINTPAYISVFVFQKNDEKWEPKLQKFIYYRAGSFGRFDILKDEIQIYPMKNNQFIFYYEDIKNTDENFHSANLYVFGYRDGKIYKTKVVIGECNESTYEVAKNPNLLYCWEAEGYSFTGDDLSNLYIVLKIKTVKGKQATETHITKKQKINFGS